MGRPPAVEPVNVTPPTSCTNVRYVYLHVSKPTEFKCADGVRSSVAAFREVPPRQRGNRDTLRSRTGSRRYS